MVTSQTLGSCAPTPDPGLPFVYPRDQPNRFVSDRITTFKKVSSLVSARAVVEQGGFGIFTSGSRQAESERISMDRISRRFNNRIPEN
ncbi:hypothetical protein ACYOEI_19680 [Singulisphaera rosea]